MREYYLRSKSFFIMGRFLEILSISLVGLVASNNYSNEEKLYVGILSIVFIIMINLLTYTNTIVKITSKGIQFYYLYFIKGKIISWDEVKEIVIGPYVRVGRLMHISKLPLNLFERRKLNKIEIKRRKNIIFIQYSKKLNKTLEGYCSEKIHIYDEKNVNKRYL